MSTKRRLGGKLVEPLIAAGASAAAGYVVKRGPAFAENTLLPWLRQAAQGAGDAAEKLPETARSVVSSGGELAEQLTERTRDVTGLGDNRQSNEKSGRHLTPDELAGRTEERERRRAKRRKATR